MRNYYVPGKWNAICDRCGLKRKNDELKEEWTGLMVCADTCWEARHPSTLIQTPREQIATPWARPEVADTFVAVPEGIQIEGGGFEVVTDFITDETGLLLQTEGS